MGKKMLHRPQQIGAKAALLRIGQMNGPAAKQTGKEGVGKIPCRILIAEFAA
jgi:hypothetical protein